MFSSGQASLPQPLRISPSMPTSPNSLTMTARRRPCALAMTWRISVVLPAPRKPVTIVQGMRARFCVVPVMNLFLALLLLARVLRNQGRDARDQAALERRRPAAPGHNAVGGAGEEPRAFDQRAGAGFVEAAEHIGPGAVAAHGGAGAARAVGEAADRPHVDFGAGGGLRGRGGEHRAGARLAVGLAAVSRPPAGDADIDGRQRHRGGLMPARRAAGRAAASDR